MRADCRQAIYTDFLGKRTDPFTANTRTSNVLAN